MGGKSSTSTSTVQIPPEVLARYNAVNAQAQNVSQTPFQPYSFDPSAFVAPFTPTQMAGLTGTNYYAGAAQPYYGAATQQLEQTQAGVQPLNTAAQGLTLAGAGPANLGQLQTQRYMSPYMSDVVGTMLRAQQMQNAQQASQLQGQAIQAGAFGGDRSGIAAANLAYQQNLANQQALAGALQSGYTQAQNVAQQQQGAQLAAQQANLQRLTGAGQQLGALGQTQYGQGAATSQQLAALGAGAQQAGLSGAQAQLAAGQAQQQTAQQGLAALYNQFLQQQAYPFQTTQFLANIAEGTGALSGSTTSTTQPSSFFSDERLKDDIEPIGETYDGQKIVKFRYKGHPEKQIGLVAQDVERHHPDAVGLAGGYKTVDYDRATRDAADMGHQSEGGAVTPERYGLGFAEGGANDNAMFRDAAAGGGLMGGDDYSRMLAAQQAMYEGLPWSKQGRPMGGMPGGGGLGIPTGSGYTPQLVTAKAAPPGQTGLQQLQGAVQTGEALEKGYGQAKAGIAGAEKAYDWFGTQRALPSSNELAQLSAKAALDAQDINPDVPRAFGGRINYADGGMPYDDNSGYMGKLGDADEPKKAPGLQPAQGPGQAGSSGLSNVASLVGIGSGIANLAPKIASGIEYLAPLLALKDGGVAGRHGYEYGGEPSPDDDTGIYGPPTYEGGVNPNGPSLFDLLIGGVAGRHGYASDGAVDDGGADNDYLDLISRQAQQGLAPPSSGMPSVKAHPAGGLAPASAEDDLPVPPVPPNQAPSGLAPLKEIYVSEQPAHYQQFDQAGGAAGESARPVNTDAPPPSAAPFTPPATGGDVSEWMKRNQDWLVPLLSGIGGMASSPSRYLGAAALQGLGAAANAYEGTQTALALREKTQAETAAIPQRVQYEGMQRGLEMMKYWTDRFIPNYDRSNPTSVLSYTDTMSGRAISPAEHSSIMNGLMASMPGMVKPPATTAAPAAQPAGGVPGVEALHTTVLPALAQGEQGPEDYKSVGPVTRNGDKAYGKYQVMGNNVPAWTEKWTGQRMTPEQFLNNPDAQEKVAAGQMQEYYNKYGNWRDAASMWHSGVPEAQAVRENRGDGNISTQNYVQNFDNRMRGAPAAAPAVDLNDFKSVADQYNRLISIASQANTPGAIQAGRAAEALRPHLELLQKRQESINTQNMNFAAEAANSVQNYPAARNAIDQLNKIYSEYTGGKTDKEITDLASLARGIGVEIPEKWKDISSNYTNALKLVSQQVADQLRAMSKLAPQSEIRLLNQFSALPEMDSRARQELLRRSGALLEMSHDMYRSYGTPGAYDPLYTNHVNKFYNTNGMEKYLKQEAASQPTAAGVTTPAAPPPAAPPSDENRRRAAAELERRREAAQATNAAEPWREPNAAFGAIP